VEDDATELQPGQMRKSEFLAQLHTGVCSTADSALAGTEHSTEGCPYLDFWFSYYQGQSSSHIERAIHRYAPETATVTSASGYIPLIAARVRQGVDRWARTGEISGVPEGVPMGLPGGLGGLVSGVGSLFFKAREGGARPAEDDPATVQAELGPGKPLQSKVRSRMERVFGRSFGDVRTHTDAGARRLSEEQNARAFTVGNHVAFGEGEYRPGTLVGDALIAHEFAHVVQQGGSSRAVAPMEIGGSTYHALEEDADNVAEGALLSLWNRRKGGMTGVVQNLAPRLRTGLRLSRCKDETCSKGDKTINVDLVKLDGATGNPATDLSFADTVFSKCCVRFQKVKDETVNDLALTKQWLGGDTTLNRHTSADSVHQEETDMLDGAINKYGLTSRMKVFYVADMDPSARGTSRPPYFSKGSASSHVNTAKITNSGMKRSLAHEFGHILLDSGQHTGIDNPSDKGNLMIPSNDSTGEDIDASQCKTIYNNA
jgi:hypothetical protein